MNKIKQQKLLVVGATGMLGSELVTLLRSRGRDVTEAIWPPGNEADRLCPDITDAQAVHDVFDRVEPDVVFNCSAFTDVDGAEENEVMATAVNGRGVRNLAENCHKRSVSLVHVSTDYVFDGSGQTPYLPDRPVNPQTAYGRSKLAGEKAIQSIMGESDKWMIVRTSWLFGRAGRNFVDNILAIARERTELKVVNDQIGCPTYAADLARCLADLAEGEAAGIYHFCNPPACSWFDLARAAIELVGLNCKVLPCPTSEFPRPAPRPPYSVLDCTKTFTHLGWTAQPWIQSLREHLEIV